MAEGLENGNKLNDIYCVFYIESKNVKSEEFYELLVIR